MTKAPTQTTLDLAHHVQQYGMLQLMLRTSGNELVRIHLSPHSCGCHIDRIRSDGAIDRHVGGATRPNQDWRQLLREVLGGHPHALVPGSLELRGARGQLTPKALRSLALATLAECLDQPLPDAKTLVAQQRAHAQVLKTERAAQTQKLAQKAALAQAKEQREIEQRRSAPTASDLDSLLAVLPQRLDGRAGEPGDRARNRVDNVRRMLAAESFRLYHDLAPAQLSGIVRSQSERERFYACSLAADGRHACCSERIYPCGGLRDGVCKHILVLLLGLVQSGQLDAGQADAWLCASIGQRAALDREAMAELVLRYQGAEAGTLDWRPVDTVPEDFLA